MNTTCQCAFCVENPTFKEKFKINNSLFIRTTYNDRCCVCLNKVGSTGQCVPLHVSTADVRTAMQVGVLEAGFDIEGPENGVLQCASCHANFFKEPMPWIRPFIFSLPKQLLCYLRDYVKQSPEFSLPKMSISELLDKLFTGDTSDIPLNPTPILPYVGLYTLIRATPSLDRVVSRKNYIYTSCLPGLSIIQGTKFAPAPNDATINTPGAVHIFDVQALGNMTAELDDVFCIPMDHGFNPW